MKYRTIVADPPWPIADGRTRAWAHKGGRRARDSFMPYDVMSVDDICRLPVADLAERDAHLFLWVTSGFNSEGYGRRVARAWGFDPINEIVWEKNQMGLGRFPRPAHEILLVCRRGNLPFSGRRNVRSVQHWNCVYLPNNGGKRHSAKPEGAQDLIESVSPGPYLELFARRQRLGWDVWGNEVCSSISLEVPA